MDEPLAAFPEPPPPDSHDLRAAPCAPPAPTFVLPGEDAPLESAGALTLATGVLSRPANVLHEHRHREGTWWRLGLVVASGMAVTGLCLAAFSGGLQLVLVPLKLVIGMGLCALICLPSLHIFAALSGGRVSPRDTLGALLVGLALTSVLLLGFVPIAWLFSQATDSPRVAGGLHLAFFFVSAHFGLRLTRRALDALTGRPVPALALWSVLFLLVAAQMTTTLRPLVGPFDGTLLAPREFFLVDWFS